MSTWINGNFVDSFTSSIAEQHYTDHDVEDIRRGLEAIIRIQRISAEALPEESRVFPSPQVELLTAAYALQHEVGELLDELPWKPWRRVNIVDPNKVSDEYADVLHFLAWMTRVIVSTQSQIDLQMLAEAFVKKARINDERYAGNVEGREPPVDPDWTAAP
jgi:hypothetical protein